MKTYIEALEEWEQDFECNDCGVCSKENFGYSRTVANGDIYRCKNCGGDILVNHEPKEYDF